MIVWKTIGSIKQTGPCALALGAFDGLHRGHMAVLEAARESGLPWGVFTFESSPSGAPSLMAPEEKLDLLEDLGAEAVCSLRFGDVKDMEAEEFAETVLLKKLGAKKLFCGEDFRFGRGARGDAALLKRLCAQYGAELIVVPPVTENGEKISSTAIRRAIEQGDLPLAKLLLGRPFGYSGEVVHGSEIGRQLGTPTANQQLPEGLVLPPFGVYASLVEIDGALLPGVTNIGVKPTVGSEKVLSETWVPEYSGDLYGKQLRVVLLQFIRPEKKFDSLEALKAEIEKNGREACKIGKKALQSETTVIE